MFVVRTRAQTRQLQREEEQQSQKEQEDGAQPHLFTDDEPAQRDQSEHQKLEVEEEVTTPEGQDGSILGSEFNEKLFEPVMSAQNSQEARK